MTPEQQFLAAAAAGEQETLAAIVAANPEVVSAKDENGLSPVMLALYRGQQTSAEWIAARCSSLNLHEAAAMGDADRVADLLAAHPEDADSYSSDGWTALHLAAFFDRPEAVTELVERGAHLQLPSRSDFARGNTPLHAAIANGARDAAARLIALGADVNARQSDGGFTPVHIAAFQSDPASAEMLLAAGADRSALNDKGQTPFDVAMDNGNAAVAETLKAA